MSGLVVTHVKKIRIEKGFTQSSMANELGISRRQYIRLEDGENRMTVDVLEKCCDILQVKILLIDKSLI